MNEKFCSPSGMEPRGGNLGLGCPGLVGRALLGVLEKKRCDLGCVECKGVETGRRGENKSSLGTAGSDSRQPGRAPL